MIDLVKTYARHARVFDHVRTGSKLELPYLERVAALVPPPGAVLDLGCGSGEPIARWLIERGYTVTGVDAVEEMLEIGRARFPRTTWLHEDMRTIELGQRFDAVIAWDSFFHLDRDDQRAMLERFARHTAPNGVLMFTSGVTNGAEIGGELFGDLLYHASLDTTEYARLLRDHGYEVVLHRVEDPDCGGRTVWIAQQARSGS